MHKPMLMIPGPTPVPEQVLLALAKQPISHRSQEFTTIMEEVSIALKWLHQTTADVLMLPSSGTGAMEAAIINFLSPGDRVLVAHNGKFGERWCNLAQKFGLEVLTVSAPWGDTVNPQEIGDVLRKNADIKALIITHSETSTGVVNDLGAISQEVRFHDAITIVDAVTSIGVMDVPIDRWGLDVVCAASQKGFMVPPGLGFVTVSPKAWEAYQRATLPKFYWDLAKYRLDGEKQGTPFTPPVNLIMALQVSLRMMGEEGLENIFHRHHRHGMTIRSAIADLGLSILARSGAESPGVTAVVSDRSPEILTKMKEEYGIILAGGQNHLTGKIFRIGHLGYVGDRDILTVISALKSILA